MLTSLQIERFGAFPFLRLGSLGTVNLIVGRNNVGKTMLLDAIRVYTASDTLEAIRKVLDDRDEVILSRSRASDDEPDDYLRPRIASLFNDRRVSLGADGRIAIGPCDQDDLSLWIEVVSLRRIRVGDPSLQSKLGIVTTPALQYEVVKEGHFADPADVLVPGLRIRRHDASITILPLSRFPRLRTRSGSAFKPRPAMTPSVSVRGLTQSELARSWDLIALRDGEARVIECLRMLSPIERLTMVEYQEGMGRRTPMVKVSGIAEPVPLKSLGDGMLRLFHLALAAESAAAISHSSATPLEDPQNTKAPSLPQPLLIDEVENGIHYATLPLLWRFLFEVAERHAIQIFATSHSWDCIEAFQSAAAATNKASDARLIRIEAKNGDKRAILFSGNELATVTRDRIEVR